MACHTSLVDGAEPGRVERALAAAASSVDHQRHVVARHRRVAVAANRAPACSRPAARASCTPGNAGDRERVAVEARCACRSTPQ